MIRSVTNAMLLAARQLGRSWRILLLLFVLYACLLSVLYLFVVTREASVWQLLLTFLLAAAAIILFFVLQSMGVSYMHNSTGTAGSLLRQAMRNCWKLIMVSLPLLVIALLVSYLLNRIEGRLAGEIIESASSAQQATEWRAATLTGGRLLFFGMIVPLAAVHLWIAATQRGPLAILRAADEVVADAFAARSVLTCPLGLLIFAALTLLDTFHRNAR